MSTALEQLYQSLVLDHAKRRVGDGTLNAPHGERFERNPTCGDQLTMQVTVDGDRLEAMAWHGDGCSISMASASVLSELAPGRSRAELTELIEAFREMLRSRGAGEPDEELLGDAIAFHGVSRYVMRVKCAMLAWVALEGALEAADAHGADAQGAGAASA